MLRIVWDGKVYEAREVGTFGGIFFNLPKAGALGEGVRPACPGLKSRRLPVYRIRGVDPESAVTVGGSLAYVRQGAAMPVALRPKPFAAPAVPPIVVESPSGQAEVTAGLARIVQQPGEATSGGALGQPSEQEAFGRGALSDSWLARRAGSRLERR